MQFIESIEQKRLQTKQNDSSMMEAKGCSQRTKNKGKFNKIFCSKINNQINFLIFVGFVQVLSPFESVGINFLMQIFKFLICCAFLLCIGKYVSTVKFPSEQLL